jgi:YegS/Rv2252/BmrU family lipid kinase
VAQFQAGGYEVHLARTSGPPDIERSIAGKNASGCDAIVVSGGDGSVSLSVNAMLKHKVHVPLGIIPSGTANDFAAFLKIPKEPEKAAEVIARHRLISADAGLVRGAGGREEYFINVCCAGMFTNISQQIDIRFKNSFGKLAYYIKGLEQLPNFVPMRVAVTTPSRFVEESVYFFFVLNSAGTGGFEKLSPDASINDGLFDFIAFKEQPLLDLAMLFVKVLSGDYLDDPGVIFFRENHFNIETDTEVESDIDGETGPLFPLEIKNIPRALEIFSPALEPV